MPCRALGDNDAAIEYLRQCLLYEPETGVKLQAQIDDLLEEGKTHLGSRPAVMWKP